jgi:hypothetical protein
MNKEIKTENLARSLRDLNHSMDPGSEQALLIMTETADKQRPKLPSFFALFQTVIPSYQARWLADEELKEQSEHCFLTSYHNVHSHNLPLSNPLHTLAAQSFV